MEMLVHDSGADFIRGAGLTHVQRPVSTRVGEFKLRALAGSCDSAKVARRRCCATCNLNQRQASVCIKLPFPVVLPILPSAQGTSVADNLVAR
jgi:hypothetical protein